MAVLLETEDKRWTVAEAKAKLSELLRRAREEGPQTIGTQKPVVVISKEEWLSLKQPRIPLGRWLVENMPAVGEFELPDRNDPERDIPFNE